MILIDLQKAFDTIDHDLLLEKMLFIGFSEEVIRWFRSYLLNRNFKVNVSKAFSEYWEVTCGVPRGSILGPLLFLLYVNDMPQALSCDLLLYADDSCLIFQHKDVKQISRYDGRSSFPEICTKSTHPNSTKSTHPNSSWKHKKHKNGKAVTVFSDSIASRIKKREMNMYVQRKLYIQAFKGATAKYMETYVTPTLEDNTPDVALIHVGTNRAANKHRSSDIDRSDLPFVQMIFVLLGHYVRMVLSLLKVLCFLNLKFLILF